MLNVRSTKTFINQSHQTEMADFWNDLLQRQTEINMIKWTCWWLRLPPARQLQRLSRKAGKVIDLFNSFTLTYGKDLEMCGKAADWRKAHGIYGIYSIFLNLSLCLCSTCFWNSHNRTIRGKQESWHDDGETCKGVANFHRAFSTSSTTLTVNKV